MLDLVAIQDKYEDEFLKFDRVENPPTKRPDLCAFLLLDRLLPGKRDIVACAEHDQITLDINPGDLAAVATEEEILTLIRCGVRYNQSEDCLEMFV